MGMSRRLSVKKPKTPSQPTACRAGTLCFIINFSSQTICDAVMIWAMMMSKSPVTMLFSELLLLPLPKMKSEAPTMPRPQMTINIPNHSRPLSSLPRNAVDNSPVKIMTAPVMTIQN